MAALVGKTVAPKPGLAPDSDLPQEYWQAPPGRPLWRDRAGCRRNAAAGRTYGSSIRDALIAGWDASDRLCGKRLMAMIPFLLPALERHGRLNLSAEERSLVLKVSRGRSIAH